MSRLCVAPIVEGHGDDRAIRILLQRIWSELLGGDYVEVDYDGLRGIESSNLRLF